MIELVYLTLTEVDRSGNSPVYKYTKINGNTDVHIRSKDKDKHPNCYDELEIGRSYVVLSENKGKKRGRWVWHKAILVPPRMLCRFRDRVAALDPHSRIPGYVASSADVVFSAASELAVLLRFERDQQTIQRKLEEHNQIINTILGWD